MTKPVKIAFEQNVVMLPVEALLPTKGLPKALQQSVKYSRIAASIAEVGIIEPLSVARQKDGAFLLLDGHVRLVVLRAQDATEAPCIIAHDDESFTYNKRVNRLAVIQEHYMIVRALDRGVSEEKLARVLNVDIKVIRQRRHLLRGISQDVAELLKDKQVGHVAFQKLRKMKPIRQLEVAELMVSANNFTASYAKALLATTKPDDLHNPDGRSIVLERQPAADPSGYAGLEDSVDYHWGGVLRAALVSTLLGVGSELGSSGDSDLARALRRGSQESIGRAGEQIVVRELDIRPTLTIRPGYPVQVLVTRDIVLDGGA